MSKALLAQIAASSNVKATRFAINSRVFTESQMKDLVRDQPSMADSHIEAYRFHMAKMRGVGAMIHGISARH